MAREPCDGTASATAAQSDLAARWAGFASNSGLPVNLFKATKSRIVAETRRNEKGKKKRKIEQGSRFPEIWGRVALDPGVFQICFELLLLLLLFVALHLAPPCPSRGFDPRDCSRETDREREREDAATSLPATVLAGEASEV